MAVPCTVYTFLPPSYVPRLRSGGWCSAYRGLGAGAGYRDQCRLPTSAEHYQHPCLVTNACWLTEVHRARWPSVWRSADSDSDSRQQWPGPRGTSGCAPVSGVWGRAVHLYSICTVPVQCLYTRRYGHPTIDTSKHTKIAHSSEALVAALHSTILRHRWSLTGP